MSRLLIIDNYDSFTYNLVELIRTVSEQSFDIFRNDRIDPDRLDACDKILISPGPGLPGEARVCCEIVKRYHRTKSILGICLGHQAIAQVFGGQLFQLNEVYHGKRCLVNVLHSKDPLFQDLPARFFAGLYHSWAVSPESLPECLIPTSVSDHGVLMSIRHKEFDVSGIQFHPESILTPQGSKIIKNWIGN